MAFFLILCTSSGFGSFDGKNGDIKIGSEC